MAQDQQTLNRITLFVRPRRCLVASALLAVFLAGCNGRTQSNGVAAPATVSPEVNANMPLQQATSTSTACEVTKPNRSIPPGERPNPDHHGNGQLWTKLWPEGRVIFKPGGEGFILEDGSLSMKWMWWRGVRGKLTIEGRRLDATGPQLRSVIPEGYGDTGFQASGLTFPTEGCWEVTGKVGESSLTFLTLVVRIRESK